MNGSTGGRVTSGDDVVLIYDPQGNYGEAEVPARELRPAVPQRSPADVRSADACLLSCIKYADRRMREAEAEAEKARKDLEKMLSLSKEEMKNLKKESACKELQTQVVDLQKKTGMLRRERDYYRDAFLSSREQVARPLESFGKGGFINTPEHLARFLAGCPATVPQATDPDVRVVVEGEDGETRPVTGVWFDELTGTVRLTFREGRRP